MTDTSAAPMGPISYLVVEFPDNKMTGDGFAALIDLVDRGIVRIIDLEFVTRGQDGDIVGLSLNELDGGEFDVSVFAGVSSGLLDQSDLDEAGSVIAPGSSAGVLLFENRWAVDFVEGMRRGGAELVAAGYVPMTDLVDALDATDAA